MPCQQSDGLAWPPHSPKRACRHRQWRAGRIYFRSYDPGDTQRLTTGCLAMGLFRFIRFGRAATFDKPRSNMSQSLTASYLTLQYLASSHSGRHQLQDCRLENAQRLLAYRPLALGIRIWVAYSRGRSGADPGLRFAGHAGKRPCPCRARPTPSLLFWQYVRAVSHCWSIFPSEMHSKRHPFNYPTLRIAMHSDCLNNHSFDRKLAAGIHWIQRSTATKAGRRSYSPETSASNLPGRAKHRYR